MSARALPRMAVVICDEIPLAQLEQIYKLLIPLLGTDAVFCPALASRLGVRFAIRAGGDVWRAGDLDAPAPVKS